MSVDKKVSFLREAITERILVMRERVADNRQRGFRVRLYISGLSALTTILLGLKGFNDSISLAFQNTALAASALVRLLTAWDAFFNYRAVWLRFQITLGQLIELDKDLKYMSVGGDQSVEENKIDEFYGQYRRIMNEHNAAWLQLRRASDPQGPPG